MIYTDMGDKEKKISRLGFGCMRLPEKDGKIDREAAAAMIDRAWKNGVTYYDTAYPYHNGDSEVFLGEVMPCYPRDSYYLATKLPTWHIKAAEDVDRYLNEQLERCRAEYFDYYLVHALEKDRWETAKACRVYEQLTEKKKEGVIRNLGFSYHGDYETFCEILDACPWDFVQIQINYLDNEMMDMKAFHQKLTEKNIPCIVMEPVRGGFLANPPESAVDQLAKAGPGSPASWAFRWCLDQENMPLILSGMSTMEQVEENLSTFSVERPLTDRERDAIEKAKDAILAVKTVPCTACGYCMDCPFGVDIPQVFGIYNRYKLFDSAFSAKMEYERLGDGHRVDSCTQCGACAPMCPQGIEIPQRLAEVHECITSLTAE